MPPRTRKYSKISNNALLTWEDGSELRSRVLRRVSLQSTSSSGWEPAVNITNGCSQCEKVYSVINTLTQAAMPAKYDHKRGTKSPPIGEAVRNDCCQWCFLPLGPNTFRHAHASTHSHVRLERDNNTKIAIYVMHRRRQVHLSPAFEVKKQKEVHQLVGPGKTQRH